MLPSGLTGLAGPATAAPAPGAAAAPADPPVPAVPQRYLDQEIAWSTCSFDAAVKQLAPGAPTTRCAKVRAPMDWAAPDAHPDIEVAIAYSEATGTSQGLMMTNPGGPGGAGLTLSASLAIDKPQLFTDYDLVGLDPRGFGQSTPLRCLTTTGELAALPTTPDYRERTRQTHRAELAEARLLAKACAATEFGQFVSSQQTVYDMELVRALLGARQLDFIGYSYGTWLASWYADTYPQRTGRFVLDSNMDWTRTQWENVNFDPFSFQRRRDTQLLPWIARHADQVEGLGSTPSRVLARYEAIRAALVQLTRSEGSAVRGDGLDGNVASAIYGNARFVRATLDILVHDEYVQDPSGSGEVELRHVDAAYARIAPELQRYETLAVLRSRYGVTPAPALAAEAPAGGAEALADARAAALAAPGDAPFDLGAVGTTVRCNDTAWDRSARWYQREADRMAERYRFYGYLNGVPMCAFWPYAPQDRDVDLAGAPRMLMVQGELDPATAYEGALRSHEATRRATRFVAIDDEGQHGQYVGSASACAEAIGDRFVFGGELPGRDTVCGTSPLPEDRAVYPVDGPVDGDAVPLPRAGTRAAAVPADLPNPLLQRVLDRVAEASLVR
ncbi:alpha/beta fold hydrolase [Vallicoccus soli]|uniref:Alpha/beta fold hydrolase n=1 Tax=Vallicoccus soli TaxID=2339232 RepID=A0A3A3Z1T9_9ACTN|nr:alpha/beta fold hydrolase [Vallicoccus soli]